MTDHTCNHEEDIAVFKHICNTEIPEIKDTLNKIFHRLEGDNGKGLMTRVALAELSVRQLEKSIPTMKKVTMWGSIWGGISGAITVGIFLALKAMS